jgi:hypothetical protein
MIKDKLLTGIGSIIKEAGKVIKVSYYNSTFDPVYDDSIILTYSGATWTSGIVLPIKLGANESVLMEQGKLLDSDQTLYMDANIPLTGSEMIIKIGLGSPVTENYQVLDLIQTAQVSNTGIYKKAYIRRMTTGSLYGE